MTTTIIQSEDFAKNDDDDDDSRRRRRSLLRRVQDVDLRNKIVLVRVDHNAVKDAQISDAFRIESSIPTLYSIVERGGRPIVMTHVNRPRDKKTKTISMDEKDGTRAIAKYLTKKLGVVFANPKVDSSLSTTKGTERENEAAAADLPRHDLDAQHALRIWRRRTHVDWRNLRHADALARVDTHSCDRRHAIPREWYECAPP